MGSSGDRTVVIVADEQPMIRAALRIAIAGLGTGAQVIEADTFTAMKQALAVTPETALVLLDLFLPGAEDYSALIHVREVHPALRFAVVSATDAVVSASIVRALGGVGFIHKLTPFEGVRTALRRLVAGQESWPASDGHGNGSHAAPDVEAAQRLAQLSARELRILLMIRAGSMNKQIAESLAISESTVKVHVSSILRKLNTGTRTQAAILAHRLLSGDARVDRHDDQHP